MKVKLLVSRAGINFSQIPGDVVEVGDGEGVRMIEAGQAVPVAESRVETATKKPVIEKAKKA